MTTCSLPHPFVPGWILNERAQSLASGLRDERMSRGALMVDY